MSVARGPGRGSSLLKRMDRWLGIPLVLLLAMVRRRRGLPRRAPRRVAVLKTAAIGDTVLLEPALRAIVSAFPRAEIRFFLGPSNHAMAEFLPLPCAVLPITNPLASWRQLRRFAPDLVIDFEPWVRVNALLAATCGAVSAGFATPGHHRHFAFDCHVRHSRRRHELQNYLQLTSRLRIRPPLPALPRLPVGECPPLPLAGRYVVFHPWSGGFQGWIKEWPERHWCALAERLAQARVGILVSGAPGDADRAAALVALLPAGSAVSIAGSCSLRSLAAVLRDALAVVSVNTGVMHLAAAVGARVVALNGPVPTHRWGALGSRAVNLVPAGGGCAFLHLGFEYSGHGTDCMERIPPSAVWAALTSLVPSLSP